MSDSELLIGEIARRAGIRASAIRYYESIGLLPKPARVGGRRRYAPETLRTLSVIRSAQRAGLTLGEIRALLSAGNGQAASERLRAIAQRRLPEVQGLIERALLVQTWLRAAAECRCPTLEECPLFDDVSARGGAPHR